MQPEHTGSGDFPIPSPRSPIRLCGGGLSCTTESLRWAAGEIIVLQVQGEVDSCTLPSLRAALDEGLDRHPAHLVVDLGRMAFCSVCGLDLLTQTGRAAAEGNRLRRYWRGALDRPRLDFVLDGDCPVRYRGTDAAVTAIRVSQRRQTVEDMVNVIGEVREAPQPEPRATACPPSAPSSEC